MISKQFKEFIITLKNTKWDLFDIPTSILIDKETGEVKKGAKNTKIYNLYLKWKDVPDYEKVGYVKNRLNVDSVVSAIIGGDGENVRLFKLSIDQALSAFMDYENKLKKFDTIQKKKAEKDAKASAKTQIQLTLNRNDISTASKSLLSQIEPYIRKGESDIEDQIKHKAKAVVTDWKSALSYLKTLELTNNLNDTPLKILYSFAKYEGSPIYNDIKSKKIYTLLLSHQFGKTWIDRGRGEYTISPFASAVLDGKTDTIISTAQRTFRDGQVYKVQVLFMRLLKSNPTLVDYQINKPYNGNEFSLLAKNELNQTVLIQTTTIRAGGWNIQRLHTRWLVQVTNTITGKKEKFTISDSDKK